MNDTEQLVKEALGKLAERTPHPGPTLNALRRKRKRHRNVFMIATAGVAAVAVLIFAGVIASDRYAPPSGNDAAAALMTDNGRTVALKYTPHWLPMGYVESTRETGDHVSREWVPAGDASGDAGSVTIRTSPGLPPVTGWDEVTVRGLKAWVQVQSAVASVVWKAQDVLTVSVRGAGDVRDVALNVAESVRADAKVVHQSPFKVEGRYADFMSGTTADVWDASANRNNVTVHVSPQKPELSGDGQPVTARGKEGIRSGNTVAVSDGGRWIWATSSVYSDRLIELVNNVELVASPDTSWVGKGL